MEDVKVRIIVFVNHYTPEKIVKLWLRALVYQPYIKVIQNMDTDMVK